MKMGPLPVEQNKKFGISETYSASSSDVHERSSIEQNTSMRRESRRNLKRSFAVE